MSDAIKLALIVERKLQSGNCSIQIGKILLDRHSWSDAARALSKGIAKGDLDDFEEASTLLQVCNNAMAD